MRRSYVPITATPFAAGPKYLEIVPSNHWLRNYIRCFWGSEKPYWKNKASGPDLVIPDTCADIIYYMDYTDNKVMAGFCGSNDRSFYANDPFGTGHLVSTFCIRFYAWGAYAFSEDSLSDTINGFFDVQSRFRWLDCQLQKRLFEMKTIQDTVRFAEQLFMKRILSVRQNQIIDDAVDALLFHRGTLSAAALAKEAFVSSRQLERVFREYTGITPKKISNLVRYQYLWNDIVRNPGFQILDAVEKYNYTDQPHLMREFKRYHAMGIKQARRYARLNVANIQDDGACNCYDLSKGGT